MNSKNKPNNSEKEYHCNERTCESCYWFVACSSEFGTCHARVFVNQSQNKIGFDTPKNEITYPMVSKDNVICSCYHWVKKKTKTKKKGKK